MPQGTAAAKAIESTVICLLPHQGVTASLAQSVGATENWSGEGEGDINLLDQSGS